MFTCDIKLMLNVYALYKAFVECLRSNRACVKGGRT